MSTTKTGTAAGVPYLAVPPVTETRRAVVAWHLLDAPRTPEAFAAAIPLEGLDAWRIYLGLPLTGRRTPSGGEEEFMRRGFEDAVLNIYGPISEQAAEELPAAWEELRTTFDLGERPDAVVGGSMGGAVAAEAAIRHGITSTVLINPLAQLAPLVDSMERLYGTAYTWSNASREVADRLDFVARAGEIDAKVLIVSGEDDDPALREPARQLHQALPGSELVTIPGLAHALADEPGVEPAPQLPRAAAVDRAAVRFLEANMT